LPKSFCATFPDCVEIVIRGDSEAPAVMLAHALRDKHGLDGIPNLIYRRNGVW
jgi:hypothetical protein